MEGLDARYSKQLSKSPRSRNTNKELTVTHGIILLQTVDGTNRIALLVLSVVDSVSEEFHFRLDLVWLVVTW